MNMTGFKERFQHDLRKGPLLMVMLLFLSLCQPLNALVTRSHTDRPIQQAQRQRQPELQGHNQQQKHHQAILSNNDFGDTASSTRTYNTKPLKPRLHNARSSDAIAITDTLISAFSSDPLTSWCTQPVDEYPGYQFECIRREIENAIEVCNNETSSYIFKVITLPIGEDDDLDGDNEDEEGNEDKGSNESDKGNVNVKPTERVVAIAIWLFQGLDKPIKSLIDNIDIDIDLDIDIDMETTTTLQNDKVDENENKTHSFHPLPSKKLAIPTPHPEYQCTPRLDINFTRYTPFSKHLSLFEQKYIDAPYPQTLYLQALATHPDWDGHGFAAKNLQWGMTVAKTLDVNATLIATPAGYRVYHQEGWESVRNLTFGWDGSFGDGDGLGKGDRVDFWYEVMRFSP